MISQTERRLLRLLRDFDFDVQGHLIIKKGIRFKSDRIWGRCRGVFDACEQLCPVIRQDEFTRRLIAIKG